MKTIISSYNTPTSSTLQHHTSPYTFNNPGHNTTNMGTYSKIPGNSMALLTMFGNHGQRASLRWGAVWLAPPHSCVAGLAWGSRCPRRVGMGRGLPHREVGLREKLLARQSLPLPIYILYNQLIYYTNRLI